MHHARALRLSATALTAAALLAGCGTSGAHHEAADKPTAISAKSDSPTAAPPSTPASPSPTWC
ncbi:hypothetical protein ACW7N6_07035 [Streptomyces sp. UC1A3]